MTSRVAIAVFVMLFGVAPCAFGNDPGRGSRQPATAGGCQAPGGTLLVERDNAVVLVDPQTLSVRELPVSADVARIAERGQALLTGIVPGRWRIERTSLDGGLRLEVFDRHTGETVFDVAFARRIELATASVSPSGRFTVNVQANNIASEVTILDAGTGIGRRVDIPHDASLAAFAIGLAFSPGEGCVAVSMERDGGDGAETWLLDLESGDARALPVRDVFVLSWLWHQV